MIEFGLPEALEQAINQTELTEQRTAGHTEVLRWGIGGVCVLLLSLVLSNSQPFSTATALRRSALKKLEVGRPPFKYTCNGLGRTPTGHRFRRTLITTDAAQALALTPECQVRVVHLLLRGVAYQAYQPLDAEAEECGHYPSWRLPRFYC